MANDTPLWAKNILEQLDSIENKLDSILSGQSSIGDTEQKKRVVTPAITSRLKNEITTIEGKCLYQHMTKGPNADWNKKRDIGLVVKHDNKLAKITSEISNKNLITIEYFANADDEEEGIPLEKKNVNSNTLEVPPLWKFDLLDTALTESLSGDVKVRNSITKAPSDQKIKLQINHIWAKILVGDKYEKERKWLRKWVDNRTLKSNKVDSPPVAKPAPKKPPAKKDKPVPKKPAPKKEKVLESASDEDLSSDNED